MITFEKVRYKNFLSSGNVWTEIDLNTSKLNLIMGQNGAGKSSFTDSITYALFGKPLRKINKPQLINSINAKDMRVEIEFTIGTDSYMVARGMKPNVFEIYKNGDLISQNAAKKDYQEFLETNILKVNYKTFCQIVILGSTTYIPFMSLTAQARREVIDNLLDIEVFGIMNSLLKGKMASLKMKTTLNASEIKSMKERITEGESYKKSFEDMQKEELADLNTKLASFVKEAEEKSQQRDNLDIQLAELDQILSKKDDLEAKIVATRDAIRESEQEIRGLNKHLDLYHNKDTCPTCLQHIEESFKERATDNFKDKIEDIEKKRIEQTNILNSYNDELEMFRQKKIEHSVLFNKKTDLTSDLRILQNSMKAVYESIKRIQGKVQLQGSVFDLDSLRNELSGLIEVKNKLYELDKIYDTCGLILKDSGIKTIIIKKFVPIINTIVNKYLSELNFFVNFQLDENFNERILSRYRDAFSYESFSEGEKAKINLALLFTWREIAKLRNSISCNLLILDEVFDSSMDSASVESLQKILLSTTDDKNVNIFVISHRENKIEGFDSILQFKKVKNFSTLTIEEN